MTYCSAIKRYPAEIVRAIAVLAVALSLSACSWLGFSTVEESERQAIERSLRKVADASQQTREYAAAARYFAQLHKKDPTDLDVTLGLARNLRYSGATLRAARILEDSLAKRPDNARLLAEYGRALIASGDSQAAISPLTKAMDVEAGNWRTLSALGIAQDQLGRHDEARKAYEAARKLSPENVAILNNLALSWALSGRLNDAVKILEQANKLPDATAQARQNLALLYGVKGEDQRAYEMSRLDLPEESARENVRYYVSLRQGFQTGAIASPALDRAKYSIQIGAYATPAQGMNAWRALQRRLPDLLSSYQIEIFDKKDDGPNPYVVWAGPMQNIKAAARLCNAMRNRGTECLVVMQ
jgi:Flp pilus assembly protein TadD